MPNGPSGDVHGELLVRLEQRVDELAREIVALRTRLGELIALEQRDGRGASDDRA